MLRSPVRAVVHLLDREGFRPESPRHATDESFSRFSAGTVHEALEADGFVVEETMAVAPVLGPNPERIASTRADAKAWPHLLELEEEIGRRPERWVPAAAVLVSARRPASKRMVK